MGTDRRLVWVLALAVLILVLWWALDHLFFPTLPMPAGAPAITK